VIERTGAGVEVLARHDGRPCSCAEGRSGPRPSIPSWRATSGSTSSSSRRWAECPGTPSGTRSAPEGCGRRRPRKLFAGWRARSRWPPAPAAATSRATPRCARWSRRPATPRCQGQHRPGDQAGHRELEASLRGGHLRGLRPERRRGLRGGAHRQPQPHGCRGEEHLQPQRRLARRAGSVGWQFERKGAIVVDKAAASEDDLLLAALEAGAGSLRPDRHLAGHDPTTDLHPSPSRSPPRASRS